MQQHRRGVALIAGAIAITVATTSCGEQEGKLKPVASAGTNAAGAEGGESKGGAGGGAAPTDDPTAGPESGAGGESPGPAAGGGAAPAPSECIYRLDVERGAGGAGASDGGAGGEGGAGPVPNIAKATSRALGDYLADEAGRALYVFGADLAGDCESPPISDCEGDCLRSWPIFHVDARLPGPGIDPAAFGSFARPDGTLQTTYYGWPLYYYASDAKPGDITGHGSGVWGLAELILPNIIVRRVGRDRFLADGAGRTLYAFAEDTLGTPSTDAESACTSNCLEQHPPFAPRYIGPISTLEARDFVSFVRADGQPQLTYKGAPLYYSVLDGRPGAVDGGKDAGFTIVLK